MKPYERQEAAHAPMRDGDDFDAGDDIPPDVAGLASPAYAASLMSSRNRGVSGTSRIASSPCIEARRRCDCRAFPARVSSAVIPWQSPADALVAHARIR